MSPVIQVTAVHYPESDGKPMGETDVHRKAMIRHIDLLQAHFQGQRVYVSGDLLIYYEQGNPKKFVVPDAFVVKGVRPGDRRTYKLWVDGPAPNTVIETTSKKTKRQDLVVKPALYARLGVKEYFLFDPTQEYLDPPLQGHRLVGDKFVPIEPDENGALISQELGLRLVIESGQLVFYRLDTGERVLDSNERAEHESAARQAAEERAAEEAAARQAETAARQAAEAEVARLREELRRQPPS